MGEEPHGREGSTELEGEACEQEGCLPFSGQAPGRLLSRAAWGTLTLMFIKVVGASLPTLFVSPSLPGLAARSIPLKVDYDWGKVVGLFDQCLPEPAPPRAAIEPPSLSQKYMDTFVPYSLWRLVFIWLLEDGCFLCQICYHSQFLPGSGRQR